MNNFETINDLLKQLGFDLNEVGFARHPYADSNVKYLYERNLMDLSMSLQDEGRFKKYDYVLSFLGLPKETCLFLRGYKINGYDRNPELYLKNYPFQNHINEKSIFYRFEPMASLEKYENQLLVNWGKGAIAWLQQGTNSKPVIEILKAPFDVLTYLADIKTSKKKTSLKGKD